jgi:hypothetical protein
MGMLNSLNKRCDTFRILLYENDETLFIGPTEEDFKIIDEILNIFAAASGLQTNLRKTKIYPINCNNNALSHLQNSNMVLESFPCKYLGMHMHYRKPTREMMHPLVQKIAERLPG